MLKKDIPSCLFVVVLLALSHPVRGQEKASEPSVGDKRSAGVVRDVSEIRGVPTRIAFGSCGHQDHDQPVLRTVLSKSPDMFIYLGDNIYGDTKDMSVLAAKYQKLADKPEFHALRSNVPTLSVGDDHDFGWTDAGKEYPQKEQSKEIFMDFWKVPAKSDRRTHPGIYGVHRFEGGGRTLQVILLDTRTFRDSLKRWTPDNQPKTWNGKRLKNAYQPDPDPSKTILGEAQWRWLAQVLREPADIRIICSSIQFAHEYNGWESWTNLPAEQAKMIATIRDAQASGVVFISGDVHWGEISRREIDGLYPLYDVTASGLTMDWHNTEPNEFRVGDVFSKNHFGLLQIDWQKADPSIVMQIVDVDGNIQVEHRIALSELAIR